MALSGCGRVEEETPDAAAAVYSPESDNPPLPSWALPCVDARAKLADAFEAGDTEVLVRMLRAAHQNCEKSLQVAQRSTSEGADLEEIVAALRSVDGAVVLLERAIQRRDHDIDEAESMGAQAMSNYEAAMKALVSQGYSLPSD